MKKQPWRTCCPWMVLDAAPLCSLPVGLLYSTRATVTLALHDSNSIKSSSDRHGSGQRRCPHTSRSIIVVARELCCAHCCSQFAADAHGRSDTVAPTVTVYWQHTQQCTVLTALPAWPSWCRWSAADAVVAGSQATRSKQGNVHICAHSVHVR
jgi:hypothetical protein